MLCNERFLFRDYRYNVAGPLRKRYSNECSAFRAKGNNSDWMIITTVWVLAVFVGMAVATPYSGTNLNPAVVTLVLALAGKFSLK
ncbi:hypothetical protein [Bacteroidetes bacterium endosymbiont of Geopemphigus sp.]|uniref:hypothetical protein n=1 Tax=Bacteroidetes bacterium endosymbiont of Geopemphigus sp. TaxID=2047937 RepID=UPI002AD40BE5|nr:hypothetical protein [Bacteroidetes bacterium endosymbiont of Geopemphigus sp.]